MSVLAGLAIGSAALGLGQAIYGGSQAVRGGRQEDRLLSDRPEYDVPDVISDLDRVPDMYEGYLSEIERRRTVPGQERAEQQIRQSGADATQSATERARTSSQALGAVSDIYSKEVEALQNLELESMRQQARERLNAMQQYGSAEMQTAQLQGQYEDQAFRLNEMADWQQRMQGAQQRKQAGYNMISGGLENMMSSAVMGMKAFGGSDGNGGSGGRSDFTNQANEFDRQMNAGAYDVPDYI